MRAAAWAVVDGATGEKGCKNSEPKRSKYPDPGSSLEPLDSNLHVRSQRSKCSGHDRPLWEPHHWSGPVHHFPTPHLQRHQHRSHLRLDSSKQLPHLGWRRQLGPARPSDSDPVRQQLLSEPHSPTRATSLGPGALQRRVAGCARQDL